MSEEAVEPIIADRFCGVFYDSDNDSLTMFV